VRIFASVSIPSLNLIARAAAFTRRDASMDVQSWEA
jgi:hypothetical protein